MIQSCIWQAARLEGKAEGLRAERHACNTLIRKDHPTLAMQAFPLLEA